jgi:hypothetical protein
MAANLKKICWPCRSKLRALGELVVRLVPEMAKTWQRLVRHNQLKEYQVKEYQVKPPLAAAPQ